MKYVSNTNVKDLMIDEDCTLISSMNVKSNVSVEYTCNICGTFNSARFDDILNYANHEQSICKTCRQHQRSINTIEQHIVERLHEHKKVHKLDKSNIWLDCDHCHQIKPVNRKGFLTKDYLKRHDDVCCSDCSHTTGRKKPEVYRKEFAKADVNHEYELLTDYIKSTIKVKVKHLVCGNTYMVLPSEFVGHGRRCPYCAGHVFNKGDYVKRQQRYQHMASKNQRIMQAIVFNPKPKVEKWKAIAPILGCDEYEVSNWGNVRNVKTGNMIKSRFNHSTKYWVVSLRKNDGSPRTIAVHRLVALTWIPGNEQNDRMIFVNHINEDRNDNWVTNLEWCDPKYNTNYGSSGYRQMVSYSSRVTTLVEQWNADHTELLNTYNSLRQAQYGTGVTRNVIKRIAKTHELNGSPYDFEIIHPKEDPKGK